MTEPYRSESVTALTYWQERGRKLALDPKATGSELRAASVGVQSIDPQLSEQLAKRATSEIGKFNQKYKP